MSIVIHPFTQKQVKLITDIYNTGTISTIDGTILSSKNKRYWLMPVSKTGLVLYDTKTSNTEVLVKLDKMYDTLGMSFVDGVITFFGRTQIPNVFDIRKLSEYVIWKSDCSPQKNGPYKLEIDSLGVPAVYNADRSRVFPILEFK
jgi:hypothetical protein